MWNKILILIWGSFLHIFDNLTTPTGASAILTAIYHPPRPARAIPEKNDRSSGLFSTNLRYHPHHGCLTVITGHALGRTYLSRVIYLRSAEDPAMRAAAGGGSHSAGRPWTLIATARFFAKQELTPAMMVRDARGGVGRRTGKKWTRARLGVWCLNRCRRGEAEAVPAVIGPPRGKEELPPTGTRRRRRASTLAGLRDDAYAGALFVFTRRRTSVFGDVEELLELTISYLVTVN